ncbi:hypothetical protein PS2_034088 [Malus domestica]
MNFLLTPSKEKAEKHMFVHCSYCKRVLKNRQALGGHLRVHKEEINAKRSRSYASHFSNLTKINHNVPPSSMGHLESFSGVHGSNPSNLFNRVTSHLDFSNRFYSNQSSWVNVSKSYENNSAMPSKFSSNSGQDDISGSKKNSFMVASSGSTVPTSVSSNPSLSFVINGVCEFNTDHFQPFTNGMPSFCVNALISHLVEVVTDLRLGPSSSQSPGFKEPSTVGSLPLNTSQPSGLGEFGRYKQTVLTSEKRKMCFLYDVKGSAEMMNALKGPKIDPASLMETIKPLHLNQSLGQGELGQNKIQAVVNSVGTKRCYFGEGGRSTKIMITPKKSKINSDLSLKTDKPPKRELLLFKDPESCVFGSGITSNAKEESKTNLDLFLHL